MRRGNTKRRTYYLAPLAGRGVGDADGEGTAAKVNIPQHRKHHRDNAAERFGVAGYCERPVQSFIISAFERNMNMLNSICQLKFCTLCLLTPTEALTALAPSCRFADFSRLRQQNRICDCPAAEGGRGKELILETVGRRGVG